MNWREDDEIAHIEDSIGELMDIHNILSGIGTSLDWEDLPHVIKGLEDLTEDLERGDWPEAWECLDIAQAAQAIVEIACKRIREKLGPSITASDEYLDYLSDMADAAGY